MHGSKTWLIPDGYFPKFSSGKFRSHESVCLLNTGKAGARVNFTLYFEDRAPMKGFSVVCPAERTIHARMDKIKNKGGKPVPKGVPYAILVQSNRPVVVQYSRMDTTQPAMALMSTMGYQG
ncbi:MAG TPA: sensory rhodopsin transducer [Planctomycetota bacterium]|nr:sensory rhodopsin transducer [Planctomycetota bacterium]